MLQERVACHPSCLSSKRGVASLPGPVGPLPARAYMQACTVERIGYPSLTEDADQTPARGTLSTLKETICSSAMGHVRDSPQTPTSASVRHATREPAGSVLGMRPLKRHWKERKKCRPRRVAVCCAVARLLVVRVVTCGVKC